MSGKEMIDYKLVPLQGGGVCAVGLVAGDRIQTTRIVMAQPGKVKTQSGTVYCLHGMHTGLWSLALQLKRPEEFAKLQTYHLV
jgi:hypothetical protein